MIQKEIPVLLLTGYLGSGKTTLLNNLLNNRRGIKFAVIVNDIGEVNIDADLIQRGGIVGQKKDGTSDDLVALSNGCICCTLKMDLVEQLGDIVAMGKFDYIVIEASGICEPEPIARTICSLPQLDARAIHREYRPVLDCIVTVVDALRMADEFDNGNKLTAKNIDDDDIESLVIQQIEFCNIILVNKASEVTQHQLRHLHQVIKALQPKAQIIDCDWGNVDLDKILNTHMFNYDQVATSAAWIAEIERPIDDDHDNAEHEHHHEHEHEHEHHHHDDDDDDDSCGIEGHDAHCHCHHHHHHDGEGEALEYGIGTMVYYRRRPFDIHKLDRFVATKWPSNVIRTKGVLYFEHQPDMSYLFEQAGKQKRLTEAGLWYAAAPPQELAQIVAADPSVTRDWDPKYGDRMIKLVFIGQNLDHDALTHDLDQCLGNLS